MYDDYPPLAYDCTDAQSVEDLILRSMATRLLSYGFPQDCCRIMTRPQYLPTMQRFDLQLHFAGSSQESGDSGGNTERLTLGVGVFFRLQLDRYGRADQQMTKDSANLLHILHGVRRAFEGWYPWVYIQDGYELDRRLLTVTPLKWVSTEAAVSHEDLPSLCASGLTFTTLIGRRLCAWDEEQDGPEWTFGETQ